MYNAQFNKDVLERHRYQCLICGTQMRTVLEAAHIRSYASDKDNRANPANGICLCKYCHAAFDAGELCLLPNGEVKFKLALTDEVAKYHFLRISSETRQSMMNGINLKFIEEKAEQVQCNWKG